MPIKRWAKLNVVTSFVMMLGEKNIGIILQMFATVNVNAGHWGLPQLASAVLFCVCLKWAGAHSSQLELGNWNLVLCDNVSLSAFRRVCFLRFPMKMAVVCSFLFVLVWKG